MKRAVGLLGVMVLLLGLSLAVQAGNDGRGLARTGGGKRVALVIGNDHYSAVSPLQNAVADARSMAAALERAGFEVTFKADANLAVMKQVVRQFKAKLSGGDEAVLFYSGHGVQLGAANYLLPVDITSDNEEQVKDDAIPLQRLLDDLQDQKVKFALAIIDACRDNPFKGNGRSIGGTRGLAPTSAANGQMVIFSAGNGQQALDRLGKTDRDANGVFTRVFLQEMERPGIEVHQVLRNVRSRVVQMAKSINHDQMPALYDQVEGDFYFKPGTQVASLEPVPTPVQPVAHVKTKEEIEDDTWSEAKGINTVEAYETYLSVYPNGRYVGQAKMKLAALKKPAAAANKPEVAAKPPQPSLPASQPETAQGQGPVMISIPGKNYELGKYEVTQKEWRDVMGSNPSKFTSCGDNCPVEQVSWNDVQEFIQKLNSQTGKQYRLPTEAEWEYACYGGSKTKFCGSNDIDAVAWYYTGADSVSTHPVGQKQANGYGLYDMSGNVSEWQRDCWSGDCAWSVLRGGSWNYNLGSARSDSKSNHRPAYRSNYVGFRVARTLP